ncbi:D-arabinitol dehydrogenase 1 [Nematostella vectensis]|uniref:D-arabinitol dehydrogenase 1 n=1 Tax=Nematostella vectensis TaxID=45351 RepID=UPI002076DE7A|nr:D-arabinitol dehydrogenase 1 [Nematostella vectensis]
MNNSVQLWDGQLSVITRPVPHVSNPSEVIVKVAYSGICDRDLQILEGELPAAKCVVLGHEFSGVVSDVGSDVKNVSIGDRVVVNPNSSCNTCKACRRGQPHFCEKGGTGSAIGVWKNGGWTQYARVHAPNIHIVPPQVSLKQAALCEPISCVLHGLDKLHPAARDSKILVSGTGVTGLLWMCILHFHGYRRVTVIEFSEQWRMLAMGLNLGFKILHPDTVHTDLVEATQSQNNTWGFDVIIECTGLSVLVQSAIKWLGYGGKLLIFGSSAKDSEVKISPYEIHHKEIQILGSSMNPFSFLHSVELVRDMSEYLDYEKLGISVFKLTDYQAALTKLKQGSVLKAVFAT